MEIKQDARALLRSSNLEKMTEDKPAGVEWFVLTLILSAAYLIWS